MSEENTQPTSDNNSPDSQASDNPKQNEAGEFFLRKLQQRTQPQTDLDNLIERILQKQQRKWASSQPRVDREDRQMLKQLQNMTRNHLLENDSVKELITKLTDFDWEVRLKAAQKLGQKGDKRAVEPLIEALNDPSAGVRAQAVTALGQLKDARVATPLVTMLDDPDFYVKNCVEQSLKQFGPAAVEPLMAILQTETTSSVRWTAIHLLGDLRDERAVPLLTEIQKTDDTVDALMGSMQEVAARAIRSIEYSQQATTKPSKARLLKELTKRDGRSVSDWQLLLKELSKALLGTNDLAEEPPQAAIDNEWLGYAGATEDELAELETRLGVRLPPSYRTFLMVSNGWRQISHFIYKVYSTEEIDWFNTKNPDWVESWNADPIPVSDEDYFVYGENQSTYNIRAEYMKTALQVSEVGDSAVYLLNPQVVTAEGEWEAWFFANWYPGAGRYRSFWEMMLDHYNIYIS